MKFKDRPRLAHLFRWALAFPAPLRRVLRWLYLQYVRHRLLEREWNVRDRLGVRCFISHRYMIDLGR